ncbi:MAG TPA: M20 family metallopeptidase [Acidimicrobiia bacterium]|jgi:amidohydrolase|nr:M20 family metallopeptidase [Acidimicrobiia bacterium]
MPTSLLEDAARILPDVVDLRRRIHRSPELGLELPNTQEQVLEAIDGLGFEVRTGDSVSSVVADLAGEGEGPIVLLRADMDALPMPEDTGLEYASVVDGAMHACGHDAHTAMLAGAARLLSERRAAINGTVRLMFQPGEEGFHGARFMIEEGAIDDVAAAFALHVSPNMPSGSVWTKGGALMASANVLEITVTGKGGHASTPFLANDPMPVAAEIVQALQVMVTRHINTFDPVVVTITKMRAGTTSNVIPEQVKMIGTLRAVSEYGRQRAIEAMTRLVDRIADAYEMDASLYVEPGYPVTVNADDGAAFALRVASELLGADAAHTMATPVMGAEDFSYVLQQRTGALAFLGACPPGENPIRAHACHSNRMTIDENAMRAGTAMYAALALEYLAGASR